MSSNMYVEEDELQEEAQQPQATQKQEDLSVKYHIVNLPSKGKFGYPETIEYRDILVRDEKIVATATAENFQKVLNNVLKSLLKDDSFFNKLTIDDRDFLLTWIWANNYPTKRKVEFECVHCGSKNSSEIDITELDIIELEEDYVVPEYKLRNGDTIKINPLTVKDEENIEKFAKSTGNEEWFVAQCMSIDLGRVMPLRQKIEYIENNISGYDMAKIRGIIKELKYGVPTSVERTCSSCREESLIDIPFQVDFFLPVL